MWCNRIRSRITMALAMGVVASAAEAGSIIYVDDDNCPGPGDGTIKNPYCSIQDAIDSAVDSDEILVAPGTYFENINFLGKAVRVYGTDGPDVTIIDAQQAGTVVTCDSAEGPDSVLEGFTITGGNGGVGGGMYNAGGSPTVTNCTFDGNWAGDGGGMFNVNSNTTVTNCTFTGNFGLSGGGMLNIKGDPTVTNCTFNGNIVVAGGGMHNAGASPTVTNCTFSGNEGLIAGGGMSNISSSPTVTNCTFDRNWAEEGGGGMFNLDSSPTVTNCTFSENSTKDFGAGGGMSNSGGSPTVTNCILWGDSPDEISGPATVSYSDLAGGFAGLGNIDADPLFVDPVNGDFRLWSGSPCIDAGNNWGVPIDANDYDEDCLLCELFPVDLDGNPRFNADEADFDPGCGIPVVVDMGAYEYQFDPVDEVTFADLTADGAVGVKDLLGLLGSWGLCGRCCCLADLDINGYVGVSDLLALLANWGPCP